MRATDGAMRTAAAYNDRNPARTSHKVAEKLAKNAGVDFEDWIAEAIAEYAEDLGVAPDDLNERERLEAIEDRIDRLARTGAAPRRAEPREPARAPRPRRESPESHRARYEDDEPRARPSRLRDEDDFAPRPSPRASGDRLERAIEEIERRAERNEQRTARALESLTGMVANRGLDGSRLEQTVADIEKRAERNEARTAAALESLQELVASRGGERQRLVQAVSEVEARAQRNADRTAKALESLSQMVAARDEERERLEAAILRANKRNEESEVRAARAVESLAAQVAKPVRAPPPPPPRPDPVGERLEQLARRAGAAPARPVDADEEALRLVSERLARRRNKAPSAEPAPAPAAPELSGALADLRGDLRLLAAKVDQLSGAAVGPSALEAFRAQTQEVERALVGAAEKVAGAERMQGQVAKLLERVERLAAAQPASAEMAQALKALADAHAKAERDNPAKALKSVEKQLDDLGARVEAAARRPSQDARAIEDLGRRIETLRAVVERQPRPQAGEFADALGALHAKLDAATASGSQSVAGLSTLVATIERLEEEMRRPASVSLDPRPLEDLARRIEGVQGQLAPKVDGLQARIDDLSRKLDRPASSPQMEAIEAALRRMAAKVEENVRATPDMRPFEDLQGALDALSHKLDRSATTPAEIAKIDAALGDIVARLDGSAVQPQMEAIEAALRRVAAKIEENATRPGPDSRPLEDLARRIEGVQGRLAPKVEDIQTTLGELSRKIDRPSRTAAEIARLEEALRLLAAQFETALSRSAAVDPAPLEALERRIEALRGAVEDSALKPQVARLEAGLAEMRARVDRPAFVPQIEAVDASLRRLASKFEEAAARPTTVSLDSRPIEDLARRIESVRASLENSPSLQPHVERLETALGLVSDKLDRAAPVDAQGLNTTLAEMNRRLEQAFRRPPELGHDQIDALAAQVEAVRATVDRQAGRFEGAEAALREAVERIENPAANPELSALLATVRTLAAKLERAGGGFDQSRLEVLLSEMIERIDHRDGAPATMSRLAEAVASMNEKLDRMNPGDVSALAAALARGLDRIDRVEDLADRDARLETLVRDVADRLDGVETRLAAGGSGGESWAHVEYAVRDLTEKVADLRAASDTRAVEQDVRALHDKLDDLAERRFVAGARDPQTAVAPEGLVELLQDIQDRLDALAAKRSTPPALEEALAELGEQMDALRATREATAREASTVADLRADHMTLDRRLDARFSGLQDVLEKLVDRMARLERDAPAEHRAAQSPAAPPRAALPDIPDREATPSRAPAPEVPVVGAPLRQREEPPAKAAAVNAHIAAARRLASAAVESEPRAPAPRERRAAGASAQAFAQRAQTMLAANSRPVLLGAAVALPVLTGLAFYEFHNHNAVKKSEIDAPSSASTPAAEAAPAVDDAPTGAIGTEPKVIAAPLAAPAPATPKPAQALVAALPAGVNTALAAAAANGDLGAEVEIAQRYLEGRTVPRDPKVAADWLQAAADAGSPFANYRLGALYEKGMGVAKDAAKARDYYTKAANAGNARAMHNLAVLYAQDGGQGKPDYAAAIDWFRKAGTYGVRDSQFNLGVLYGRGLGAGQDLAQSWLWFSLAARQGDTDAAHKRDEVALRMDGRAMTAAKKLLDDFKVLTPDPAVNDAPPVPPAAADAAPDKKDAKKPV
jgi:localization factor PodJL